MEERALVSAEFGYAPETADAAEVSCAKYSVGAWTYTSAFDELEATGACGAPVKCARNRGVYPLAERQVFSERGNAPEGIAAFARLGFSEGCVSRFDRYLGLGDGYTGLLPGRDRDKLGVAFTQARNDRP